MTKLAAPCLTAKPLRPGNGGPLTKRL